MAELVPILTGALAALCIWIASGTGSRVGSAPRASIRFGAKLVACAVRVGGFVPDVLAGTAPMRLAAEEARRVASARGRAPALSRSAATGLVILVSAAASIAGAVVALSAWGMLVGAVVPVAALAVTGSRREAERSRSLEAAMPEAFGALAVSLGSGHSLQQALRFVGNHAREPVGTEFMRASFEISCGASAPEALDGMLGRLSAPGLSLVALALKVSQRTGAPLRDMLTQAAGMVGDRIELERRLEVKTAQARMSARVVAAMPVVMIAALTLLSADFRAGLSTPVGSASIAISVLLDACAWYAIHRIMAVRL